MKLPYEIMSADATYQKPLIYNKCLPYASKLNEESEHLLEDIKRYLSIAVQKSELWPGAIYWTQRLNRYMLYVDVFNMYKCAMQDFV